MEWKQLQRFSHALLYSYHNHYTSSFPSLFSHKLCSIKAPLFISFSSHHHRRHQPTKPQKSPIAGKSPIADQTMAKKRKSIGTCLDEVDRTMYASFCTAANSLSQLYTHAMNHQKLSFNAGERHALVKTPPISSFFSF